MFVFLFAIFRPQQRNAPSAGKSLKHGFRIEK
jgi:hypothetical protein